MNTTILEVIPKMHSLEKSFVLEEHELNRIPIAQTTLPMSDSNGHFIAFDKTVESLAQYGFRVAAQKQISSGDKTTKIVPATITILSENFQEQPRDFSGEIADTEIGMVETSLLFSVKYTIISPVKGEREITYNHYVLRHNGSCEEVGIWEGEDVSSDDWPSLSVKLKEAGVEDIIIT